MFTAGANTPTAVGVQRATAVGGSYRVGLFAQNTFDVALRGRSLRMRENTVLPCGITYTNR